jgi:hypothetical protein
MWRRHCPDAASTHVQSPRHATCDLPFSRKWSDEIAPWRRVCPGRPPSLRAWLGGITVRRRRRSACAGRRGRRSTGRTPTGEQPENRPGTRGGIGGRRQQPDQRRRVIVHRRRDGTRGLQVIQDADLLQRARKAALQPIVIPGFSLVCLSLTGTTEANQLRTPSLPPSQGPPSRIRPEFLLRSLPRRSRRRSLTCPRGRQGARSGTRGRPARRS